MAARLVFIFLLLCCEAGLADIPRSDLPMAGAETYPSCLAPVLPDGSTQFTQWDYTTNGLLLQERESYTLADGTVGTRTNYYAYATNNVDLVGTTNTLGQYVNLGYNTNHQVTTLTDALGEISTLAYDAATRHLTSLASVGGQTASFSYYVSNTASANGNMLSNVVWSPTARSVTLTWSNGLPRIVHATGTNIPDLWTTNFWDGLNRSIGTSFTDGTGVSNVFDRLDVGATKDRLGHWTYFGHDAFRHLTSVTDALSNLTTLAWCDCGALSSVTDALTNTTHYYYNNQGLLTNIAFPDASSLTYTYDAVQRLLEVADGSARSLTAGYNNQSLLTVVSNSQGALERIVYDAADRPIQVTDAGNVTITNIFDPLNRTLARIWPDGVGETYLWATNGLVASTNRNGKVTRYLRDNAGRLTAVTNANLESVLLGYNSLGQVTDLWDGRTNHTVWHRNQYGWVTNKVDALGREVFRHSFDAAGRIITNTTPQFGNSTYGYDAVGNLLSIAYPNQTITYTYNALNELRTMADAVGTTIFSNTPTGNLLSEDGPWSGDTVAYGYTDGLRTSMSVGSQGFGYGYDSAWRMYTITSPSGTFNYGYETARPTFLSTIGLPNGAWVTNHYDSLSRWDYTALANSWGHVLDGEGYQYDLLGLKTNITRNLGLTTSSVSVGYDNIGQITSWSAKEAGGTLRLNEQQGWAFDKSDNLLFRTNGALVQTFNSDAVNELTNITRAGTMTLGGNTLAPATSVTVNGFIAQTNGDFTFAATNLTLANNTNSFTNIAANAYGNRSTNILTLNLPASPVLRYDLNGNLTNDGSRSFVYNAENQLTNIVVTNAATTASTKTEFVYDGLGRRRIARDYTWTGAWSKTNEVRLIYDGYQLVQERDTNNNVLVTYTRGLDLSGSLAGAGGIGGLLARTDTNGSTYYHADGSGNVTALIDGQQTMAARYMYGAFGSLIGKWGEKADANAMQFSSMPRHAQSGLSLYAMRAYDPNLQRWLNQDPQGEAGGVNLYGFVGNNSLGSVDPLGMGVLADLGDIGAGFVNAIERFDNDPDWFSHLGDSLVSPAGALMNADAAFQGAVNANQQLNDMGFANKQDYLLNGLNLNCTVTAGNMQGIRAAALAAGAAAGAYIIATSMMTGNFEGGAEEMTAGALEELEAAENQLIAKSEEYYGPIRNVDLAGKTHPVTGIPFNSGGFPDFSSVAMKQVKIEYTGTRVGDFAAANTKAGLSETPEGFTWHHVEDGKTMQLVPTSIHMATGHTGGFSMFPH